MSSDILLNEVPRRMLLEIARRQRVVSLFAFALDLGVDYPHAHRTINRLTELGWIELAPPRRTGVPLVIVAPPWLHPLLWLCHELPRPFPSARALTSEDTHAA